MAKKSSNRTAARRKSAPRSAAAERGPLIRAALAVSLDGFIADADGGVEWLNPFFSPEMDFVGFMNSIGAVIMGRNTFGDAVARGGGGSLTGQGKCVVLTHRPLERPPSGVEAFGGDVSKLADRMRGQLAGTGKDIWLMGGGQAIDAFLAAGQVDRLEMGIMPILLGDGIPLFPKHSRGLQGLAQTHCRALKNGVVELWYEPQDRL
jgi:dihydrofolate reductase